ncbi:fused phosphoenolpyruvate-protein phosphotransferase PtsP/GAF domain protein [compost metagenome]
MCGELAGKPLEALALMAVGMTRLSMGPASIGPIKELVLNLDLKPIQAAVRAALSEGADGVSIRALLQEWIEKQNLPV